MRLTGKRIAILVAEGVEDLEFYVPLMRLQEEGAEVIAAGLDLKSVHGKNGLEITPTAKIDSLKSKDLFALVIPGGWAPDKLRRHSVVTNLVKEMNDERNPSASFVTAGWLPSQRASCAVGVRRVRSASRMTWSMPGRPGWTNLHSMTATRFGVGSLRTFQPSAVNWSRRWLKLQVSISKKSSVKAIK